LSSARRALVVIPNFNGAATLPPCLKAVFAQRGAAFDVVLVDNGSHDGSAQAAQRRYPRLKTILNPQNRGFGPALNQGAALAAGGRYDSLIFLNNDAVPRPGSFSRVLATLRGDPKAALCNSLVTHSGEDLIDSAGGAILNLPLGILGRYLAERPVKEALEQAKAKGGSFEVFYADACAVAVRWEAFQALGGFTEDYFMYFEEVDLSWRARLMGWRVLCEPRSRVEHRKGSTPKSRALALKILRGMDRNLLATCFKLLGLANLLWVLPVLFLARLASALIYLAVSPRVFVHKLLGLAQFFLRLPGLLRQRWHWQGRRVLDDSAVLGSNPGDPFQWAFVGRLIAERVHDIRRWYAGRAGRYEGRP
jgi:GT2 family glycosyltransferase